MIRTAKRKIGVSLLAIALASLGGVALVATPAQAAVHNPTNADELELALQDTDPTIEINLSPITYTLNENLPRVTGKTVLFNGNGAVIDGVSSFEALDFQDSAVTLQDLTIVNSTAIGLTIDNLALPGLPIVVSNVESSNNVEGFYFEQGADSLTLSSLTAEGNGENLNIGCMETDMEVTGPIRVNRATSGEGLRISGTNCTGTLDGVSAEANSNEGVSLTLAGDTNVELTNLNLSNNGDGTTADVFIQAANNAMILGTDWRSSGAQGSGLYIEAIGDSVVDVLDSSFEDPTSDGARIVAADRSQVSIADSSLTGAGSSGVYIAEGSTESVATLTNLSVTGNDTGVRSEPLTGITQFNLASSTLSGNATRGLQLPVSEGASAIISNSTISGNGDGSEADASLLEGSGADSRLWVQSSTFLGNTGTQSGLAIGGAAGWSGLTLENTVVSGSNAGADLELRPGTAGASMGAVNYNLVTESTGETRDALVAGTGNVLDLGASLDPLAATGGPTQTHKPQLGSPVINAGDPAGSRWFTDQRGFGFPRIFADRMDIGSHELQAIGDGDGGADPEVRDGLVDGVGELANTGGSGLQGGALLGVSALLAAALSSAVMMLTRRRRHV